MRNINEKLIGENDLEEQATGIESDESKTEGVGEESEEIISEINAEKDEVIDEQNGQTEDVLDEQLFDGEYNPEDFFAQDSEDEEPSEDIFEQMESPNPSAPQTSKESYEKVPTPDEDKIEESRTQMRSQTVSSEPQHWMENLEFILDIPLQVDIQLGQTKIPLREMLELSPGAIIKLNKSENDPVELLINGKLVAEGQIVVTDGNILGIQVSAIVKRLDRIRSLR